MGTKNSSTARAGELARDRIETRKRRGLSPSDARLPEVERLLDEGRSQATIAQLLHVGERTIRDDVRRIRDSRSQVIILEGPKKKSELAPQFQAMLEPTLEGFAAFFEYIEGKELPSFWMDWLPAVLGEGDVMINVPPRHAKSTIIAAYCCWRIVMDRNVHIIWASKTEQAAKKWSRSIGNRYLVKGGRLAQAFGEFKPERAGEEAWQPLSGNFRVRGASEFTVSEYTLQIRGMGQQVLGSEADLVILDDATDKKTADSETASDDELEKIRGEFFSRLQPNGKVIVVGQRVAYEDLYSRLLTADDELSKNWTHLQSKAIIDEEEGITLWPELWPLDRLRKVRSRVGKGLFSTMYQQDPYPADERVFSAESLKNARDATRSLSEGMRFGSGVFATVVSVDPAFKKPGAIIVADVAWDQTRRTFDCVVRDIATLERGAQNRRDLLVSFVLTYRPDFLIYEDVGVTQDLEEETWFQDLRRLTNIIPHRTTGHNKGDPEAGVESLSIDFDNQNISTPYGDEKAKAATDALEAEAYLYPNGTYDKLMALWFVKWNRKRLIPRGALPTRFADYKPWKGVGHVSRLA